MPLLNRPGVDVSHLEFFVARAQIPRDVQLCAMRFRATPRTEHRTNALLVPFPTDAPAAARAQDVVRVGDLNDGYSELFLDLARNFLTTDRDDESDRDDDSATPLDVVEEQNTNALPCARKIAVRVCADWTELLQFREKNFRLSKTLKPILQVTSTQMCSHARSLHVIMCRQPCLFFFVLCSITIRMDTPLLSVFSTLSPMSRSSSSSRLRFQFRTKSTMLSLYLHSRVRHPLQHLL